MYKVLCQYKVLYWHNGDSYSMSSQNMCLHIHSMNVNQNKPYL